MKKVLLCLLAGAIAFVFSSSIAVADCPDEVGECVDVPNCPNATCGPQKGDFTWSTVHVFHGRDVNLATARTIIAAGAIKSIPERHSAVTVTTGIFRSGIPTVMRSVTEASKGNRANNSIYLS